jgi:hypothetical protein
MDWQQLVSLVIVASAAVLLGWSRYKRRKFSFAQPDHCGCMASTQTAPQSSIIFHARKGQRPEVRVRMR